LLRALLTACRPDTTRQAISCLSLHHSPAPRVQHVFPTRRSSDLASQRWFDCPVRAGRRGEGLSDGAEQADDRAAQHGCFARRSKSEEHTSELQSRGHLVCRLLLEKKKQTSIWQHAAHTNTKSLAA